MGRIVLGLERQEHIVQVVHGNGGVQTVRVQPVLPDGGTGVGSQVTGDVGGVDDVAVVGVDVSGDIRVVVDDVEIVGHDILIVAVIDDQISVHQIIGVVGVEHAEVEDDVGHLVGGDHQGHIAVCLEQIGGGEAQGHAGALLELPVDLPVCAVVVNDLKDRGDAVIPGGEGHRLVHQGKGLRLGHGADDPPGIVVGGQFSLLGLLFRFLGFPGVLCLLCLGRLGLRLLLRDGLLGFCFFLGRLGDFRRGGGAPAGASAACSEQTQHHTGGQQQAQKLCICFHCDLPFRFDNHTNVL